MDWKLALPKFSRRERRKARNYRPVSLTVPAENMEKTNIGATEKHLRSNKIIAHSQHRLTKEMCCLTTLISFYFLSS